MLKPLILLVLCLRCFVGGQLHIPCGIPQSCDFENGTCGWKMENDFVVSDNSDGNHVLRLKFVRLAEGQLYSPVTCSTNGSASCLTFAYWYDTDTTKRLEVNVQRVSDMADKSTEKRVWILQQAKVPRSWNYARVPLTTHADFVLIFRAKRHRTNSLTTRLFIDDIGYQTAPCGMTTTPPPPTSLSHSTSSIFMTTPPSPQTTTTPAPPPTTPAQSSSTSSTSGVHSKSTSSHSTSRSPPPPPSPPPQSTDELPTASTPEGTGANTTSSQDNLNHGTAFFTIWTFLAASVAMVMVAVCLLVIKRRQHCRAREEKTVCIQTQSLQNALYTFHSCDYDDV